MKYILASARLLGGNCRYDGKHNANADILSLLGREDVCLIPVCPEQLGGLTTPRLPSERLGDQVINSAGDDVTRQYAKGAAEALRIAELYGCSTAILKERSPSCGSSGIYDGTFTHTRVNGQGCTAELLRAAGIQVFGESEIPE